MSEPKIVIMKIAVGGKTIYSLVGDKVNELKLEGRDAAEFTFDTFTAAAAARDEFDDFDTEIPGAEAAR